MHLSHLSLSQIQYLSVFLAIKVINTFYFIFLWKLQKITVTFVFSLSFQSEVFYSLYFKKMAALVARAKGKDDGKSWFRLKNLRLRRWWNSTQCWAGDYEPEAWLHQLYRSTHVGKGGNSKHCKKRASGFPVPSRDVTYQTLTGRELLNYSWPGRVW